MPVTKTAKRALRSSKRKLSNNKLVLRNLGVAIRIAKRLKTKEKIIVATSLADRAAKKRVIHKNKAARIKSSLSKLIVRGKRADKPKLAGTKRSSKK